LLIDINMPWYEWLWIMSKDIRIRCQR
jgi:hypothetical protein